MKDLFRIVNWKKKEGLSTREISVSVMDSNVNRFDKIVTKYEYEHLVFARDERILFAIMEDDDEYLMLVNESLSPENEVVDPIVDFLEQAFEETKQDKD